MNTCSCGGIFYKSTNIAVVGTDLVITLDKTVVPRNLEKMTQWYFQKEICKKTLLTLHTSAVSLQKYYCDPDWDNFNITIQHLNTKL